MRVSGGFGQAERSAVAGGVVGGVVGPAAPDHADPGAGQNTDSVSVMSAAGPGAVVNRSCPGAGLAAAVGEVDQCLAQAPVAALPEDDGAAAAGGAGRR